MRVSSISDFNPDLELQLPNLIQWSTEQLKDEDFRQSFIGNQMIDLELKKKEATRIIHNDCLTIGALSVSEMLLQEDKRTALAEHQMKMVTKIFSVYGIDCLAGLTKKFEKTTSLVDFGNGFVSLIVKAIPKAVKFQEYIKTAAATGLTKIVGSAASKLSYSYVEKHIKGIPVKWETFYTDPDSAGIIVSLLDDAFSFSGRKLQGEDEKDKIPKTKRKPDLNKRKKKK